jgi:predicted metalloprotease with PDZ domain
LAELADQFVLARIVNMRGVDLTTFDFDYDLTWQAFFMNSNEHVYGRYGGRDEGPAEKGLSIAALKYAMWAALAKHGSDGYAQPERLKKDVRQVEQFAAARRVKNDACIHCHQVHDFRREQLMRAGKWSRDEVWVYPPPENIGLTLDAKQGDRIQAVKADSPASGAGLRAGDVIESLGDCPIASYGDVQYTLHHAPKTGKLTIVWHRDGEKRRGDLMLRDGWRESDISWRGSMWGLEPQAFVYGQDLTVAEKRELGLSAMRLAFRQGNFVPPESRRAGIRARDIILGIDGRKMEMKMLQFNAHVRLNYKVGDRIVFNVIRNGMRQDISMELTSRIKK